MGHRELGTWSTAQQDEIIWIHLGGAVIYLNNYLNDGAGNPCAGQLKLNAVWCWIWKVPRFFIELVGNLGADEPTASTWNVYCNQQSNESEKVNGMMCTLSYFGISFCNPQEMSVNLTALAWPTTVDLPEHRNRWPLGWTGKTDWDPLCSLCSWQLVTRYFGQGRSNWF